MAPSDLLVLDEAASRLDAHAEEALSRLLLASGGHGTGAVTLYVTHRLAITKAADVILVFAGGRLVESGTHEELLHRQGAYHALYAAEVSGYE